MYAVESACGAEFIQSPTDQRLLPGVRDRVAELKAIGATIVIASNQGGVAARHKSLEDAIAEMQYCLKLLPDIEYGFLCPDFEGNTCYYVHKGNVDSPFESAAWQAHAGIAVQDQIGKFRKPDAGMLVAAMKIYPKEMDAIMIGDRPSIISQSIFLLFDCE